MLPKRSIVRPKPSCSAGHDLQAFCSVQLRLGLLFMDRRGSETCLDEKSLLDRSRHFAFLRLAQVVNMFMEAAVILQSMSSRRDML